MYRPVNRIVYFFEHCLPCAIEFFKDAVGVRGPAVGFGIAIVMIQKAEDIGTKAPTLRKLPARMTLAVISPKKRSTRLSQEEEVGMKWM